MATKDTDADLANLLLFPMIHGVEFQSGMNQVDWFINETNRRFRNSLHVVYEKRPSEGFEFNYQRDKFLSNRDIMLAFYMRGK